MRNDSTHGNITLNIFRNHIFLNDCIRVLSNKYTFIIIFMDNIFKYKRKRLFTYFDSWLTIETNQIILYYLTLIILTWYDNPIEFITRNRYILLYFSFTYHFLIRICYDSILCVFIYFIEIDNRKTAKCLYPVLVFTNIVSTDFNFTSQANFNS